MRSTIGWSTARRLPQLFFTVLFLVLLSQVASQSYGTVPCACPAIATVINGTLGCATLQTPIRLSTTVLPGASLLQCVPSPAYDASWGALYIPFCFNTSCYPTIFSTGTISAAMTLDDASLPVGRYSLSVALPPPVGNNALGLVVNVPSAPAAGNPSTLNAGSMLVVPQGGLPGGLTLTFSLPSGLTANGATATLTSLDAVLSPPAPPPPPASPATSPVDPCADVVEKDQESGLYSCPEGKIMVKIFDNAGAFDAVNYARYTGMEPNATRCVDPPVYDTYSTLLTWQLNWTLSCYKVNATPIVMVTEVRLPGRLSSMAGNASIHGVMKRQLIQDSTINCASTGFLAAACPGPDGLDFWFMMGSQNLKLNNITGVKTTTAGSYHGGDQFTLQLPVDGLNNISFAIKLKDSMARPAAGSGTFQISGVVDNIDYGVPYTDSNTTDTYFLPQAPDVYGLMDHDMLVTWGVDLLLLGSTTPDYGFVVNSLGYPGRAQVLGSRFTVRLALRDTSWMMDCSQPSQNELRALLAAISGLRAGLFRIQCQDMVKPGAAANMVPIGGFAPPPSPPPSRPPSSPPSPPSPSPAPPPGAAAGRRRRRVLATGVPVDANITYPPLPNDITSCPDAHLVLDISLDMVLPDNATYTLTYADLALPADVLDARLQQQRGASATSLDAYLARFSAIGQSNLNRAVSAALTGLDPILWCTSGIISNQVIKIQGGFTAPDMDSGNAAEYCNQGVAKAVALLGPSNVLVLGPGFPPVCSALSNCLDCWPYPISQWAIILSVLALVLLLVTCLIMRAKLHQRWHAADPVLAGQLDDRAILLKVQARQQQELEMQRAEQLAMKQQSNLE
ncbi:hypothetical protein V8C86DRAFT_2717616 [Haematococcus lacustris]